MKRTGRLGLTWAAMSVLCGLGVWAGGAISSGLAQTKAPAAGAAAAEAAVTGASGTSAAGTGAAQPAATDQRISYWLPKPSVFHFHTEQEAAENQKTLQDLGCVVTRQAHDGHIDLQVECRLWRSLKLADVNEVEKWQKWLQAKGFAVIHNTPAADHPEVVRYQLPRWQNYHLHDPARTEAQLALLKMLGCEVRTVKHDGHEDVVARLTQWQQIGLATHAEAHSWMAALQKMGFAVQHEH